MRPRGRRPALDTLLGDDSDDDDDAPPLQAADVSDDDDAPPPPPYVYRPSQDDEFMIGALLSMQPNTAA